jgi:hypothetical protein
MQVTFVDKMGSDLTVVNAARVSYAKQAERFEDKDEKLIKYLADTQSLVTFCSCFHTVSYFSTHICGTTTGQASGWIGMERDIQTLCGLSTHTVQTHRMERSS